MREAYTQDPDTGDTLHMAAAGKEKDISIPIEFTAEYAERRKKERAAKIIGVPDIDQATKTRLINLITRWMMITGLKCAN